MTNMITNDNYVPLSSPSPVTEQAWPPDAVPLVSVRVTAYNHALYIEECLRGILMQETTFPIEILIHDDASTDETAEIIRRFECQHPQLMKVVYQTENQYSQGATPASFLWPLTRGKYVAICEGDDYWTDRGKLQKQVSVLEGNSSLQLCIHKAEMINVRTGDNVIIGRYRGTDGVVSLEEVIVKTRGQIPTASTLMRRQALEKAREFRKSRPWLTVGDIYTHIFGAMNGGAYYIDEVMSVYRYLAPGSWNSRIRANSAQQLEHAVSRIRSYEELDTLLGGAHRAAFHAANRKQVVRMLRNSHIPYLSRVGFGFRNLRYLELKHWISFFPLPVARYSSALWSALRGSGRGSTDG